MATATITRPQCENNYTALPNELFNFGHHYDDLKPRDVAVLNYLLSKPQQWNINRKAIANAVNMCERTVSSALKVLQKKGFAGFKRTNSGRTEWFIKFPQAASDHHIAKNPIETFAPCKPCNALVKNEGFKEKNKETTNPVVVSLPKEINTSDVRGDLGQLTKEQQVLTLTVFVNYIESLKIKGERYDAIAVIRGFVKKAKNGLLSVPVEKSGDKPTISLQDRKKRAFIERNIEKLRRQMVGFDRINVAHPTYDGWIYARDLLEVQP